MMLLSLLLACGTNDVAVKSTVEAFLKITPLRDITVGT